MLIKLTILISKSFGTKDQMLDIISQLNIK